MNKIDLRTQKNNPYAWQSKESLRLIQRTFTGVSRVKAKVIYLAITEIASDFSKGNKEPDNWIGLLVAKTGIGSRKEISKFLKLFEPLNLVSLSKVGSGKGGHNKIIVQLIG